MKTPEWLKPSLYGAIAGAAIVAIAGFSWGGWMTSAGANELADELAQDRVVAALVPVCLEISNADPDRVALIEAIQAASGFRRRDALIEAGWATVPGADAPNRDLALACVEGLELDGS
ncbi:hypothetical protein V8J82_22840 [Gymnodinialimonas sp. 2305UL16-5]|uniref:hypothetical protein n=1 Tax=Gymnodinialimonas mytili TaxID=3126503 RepID=UPI00309E3DDD